MEGWPRAFCDPVFADACEVVEGDLPRRQERPAIAWVELHQEELMANWDLIMNGEQPFRIQPLQ